MLRPDLHLQSEIKEGSDADRERVVGFLRGGAGTGPKDTSGGREEKLYMHDFVRNEEVGWTAEQVKTPYMFFPLITAKLIATLLTHERIE